MLQLMIIHSFLWPNRTQNNVRMATRVLMKVKFFLDKKVSRKKTGFFALKSPVEVAIVLHIKSVESRDALSAISLVWVENSIDFAALETRDDKQAWKGEAVRVFAILPTQKSLIVDD